jgi:hypothetical protein
MELLSVNLPLPVAPLTQDQKLYGELLTVYNAIRVVAQAHELLQPKILITAFENLTYGQLVAIYNDAGTGKARLAQDGVRFTVGWCSIPGGSLTGEATEITLRGTYPSLPPTTLTPGAKYYLSAATPGALTAAVTGQIVGVALSDTELLWMPQL